MKKYQIIYADPPWSYDHYSDLKSGKLASRVGAMIYNCMSIEEICSLPIKELADRDCALFMWITSPNLDRAFEVISAWGFKYKTIAFTWVKVNSKSWGYYMGLGYWTRANPEICLLATKGNPHRVSKDVEQLVVSQLMEHSHKPAIIREKIVQLMGDLPRVELFARKKIEGWDCLGFDVDGKDIWQSIEELAG